MKVTDRHCNAPTIRAQNAGHCQVVGCGGMTPAGYRWPLSSTTTRRPAITPSCPHNSLTAVILDTRSTTDPTRRSEPVSRHVT
jgi:hypothetical protein